MQIGELPVNTETAERHGGVPSSFLVTSLYEIKPIRQGLGGWSLTEVAVESPWVKDYDAGGGPLR